MKMAPHIITVRGSGRFPLDMLRYDACYPRSEEDTHRMQDDWAGDLRDVELVTIPRDKHWKPTAARWKSFTWEVVDYKVKV